MGCIKGKAAFKRLHYDTFVPDGSEEESIRGHRFSLRCSGIFLIRVDTLQEQHFRCGDVGFQLYGVT